MFAPVHLFDFSAQMWQPLFCKYESELETAFAESVSDFEELFSHSDSVYLKQIVWY